MKNKISKNYFLLGIGLCLLLTGLFIGQRFVSASSSATAISPADLTETKNFAQNRCGWVSNPTTANWWLDDKYGEWTIGMQGVYQASGVDLPDFGKKWVVTNAGGHGYGCACMNVTTDKKEMKILTIKSVTVRPLSACRKDRKLKKPE